MQCSFCRNDNATNEHPYEGDFVFCMCDDCNARYKEHPQLGPKYLICKCDPDNPRELDLSMAQSEIKQNSKPKEVKFGENKEFKGLVIDDVKVSDNKVIASEEITKEYVRKVPKKHKRSFPTGY